MLTSRAASIRHVLTSPAIRSSLPPASSYLLTHVPSIRAAFSSQAEASATTNTAQDPSVIKAAFRSHLESERDRALLGGGQARIDKQHAKGSLTARERLTLLFDSGTFRELDQLKAHLRAHTGIATTLATMRWERRVEVLTYVPRWSASRSFNPWL